MAGKKRLPTAPPWFNAAKYIGSSDLDPGDWLLNLQIRSWLRRTPNAQTEAALREIGPLFRRKDTKQIKAMHLSDVHSWVSTFSTADGDEPFSAMLDNQSREHLPPGVHQALREGNVREGVAPVSLQEWYFHEQRLPEKVRQAGAKFRPGGYLTNYPPEFGGTFDDAFGLEPSKQMTGRFVRVDFTLPDDVLNADFQAYLSKERNRLKQVGGEQPYREAAKLKLKAHALRTLSNLNLLEYLDLDRWQKGEGLGLSRNAVRELAGIDRGRATELDLRVKLVLNSMQLEAWFARLSRSAEVNLRRR